MPRSAHESGHLVLVGDPDAALGVAAGMMGEDHAELSVRDASMAALDRLRRSDRPLVMVDVPIDLDDLPARLRGQRDTAVAAASVPAAEAEAPIVFDGIVGHTVADVERALILQTLSHCHGNRTMAAGVLGISVRTMRNKLRSFIEDGIVVDPAS
jgi:transcriptional regulator with GAF, ATPase, and Fis domain